MASSVLKDKIHAERRAGLTVVLTSHLMGEVDELADDLAFLLDGRVRFAGALEALKAPTRQATLERAIAKLMAREAA